MQAALNIWSRPVNVSTIRLPLIQRRAGLVAKKAMITSGLKNRLPSFVVGRAELSTVLLKLRLTAPASILNGRGSRSRVSTTVLQ